MKKDKKNLQPAIQYLNEIWPLSKKSLATPALDDAIFHTKLR